MSRRWAMPTHETFSCPPIKAFVERWLNGAQVIIDPFARDSKYGTITNDLNPKTSAQYHLTALEFLTRMHHDGVKVDAVIFDPPYSLRQVKELYESVGRTFTQQDSQMAIRWPQERDIVTNILKVGGVALCFGWNTAGLGKKRSMVIEEILLVAHGGAHNDTICTAERKTQHQESLL